MYQFGMSTVSSYLGDKGQFEVSNEIKKKILKLLLINRKGGGINEALYGMCWNRLQINSQGVEHIESIQQYIKESEKILEICTLFRDKQRQCAYQERINRVKKKIE